MIKARTTMVFTMVLMLGAIFQASAEPDVGWFRSRFGNLSWAEVKSVVKTPREICGRVRHHVRYRNDVGDSWTPGAEAWKRGYGDCEDIAAAVVELCREIGATAEIVVYYSEGDGVGHAVVMGEWEGKKWISSNGWFEKVSSMNDARRSIAKEMGWDRRKVTVANGSAFNSGIIIASKPSLGPVRSAKRRSILR